MIVLDEVAVPVCAGSKTLLSCMFHRLTEGCCCCGLEVCKDSVRSKSVKELEDIGGPV